MATTAPVAKRRYQVGELWLRGLPAHRIARLLHTSDRTIHRDIEAIRADLEAGRTTDLEKQRDRSIAALRAVQVSAWSLYERLRDDSSSKVGALNTIVHCEHEIARISGVLEADVSINQTTTVTLAAQEEEFERIQETIAEALMPYQEARIAVAAALAKLQ
jgi:hypothetical protein